MIVGTIIKGLAGVFINPAIPVICTIIEFAQGKRTGISTAFSLGLSALIDLDCDLDVCGYEIIQSPPKNLTHLSLRIAESTMEIGFDELAKKYVFSEKTSRIYMPTVSIVDMSSGNPVLDSVWKAKSDHNKVPFLTDFSTKSYSANQLFNLTEQNVYKCDNFACPDHPYSYQRCLNFEVPILNMPNFDINKFNKYHCGEIGCPGHDLITQKCKKRFDPSLFNLSKMDPIIPVKHYCGEIGCPGHDIISQKCKNEDLLIFNLPNLDFYKYKKHYCGEVGCPGHDFIFQKCKKRFDPF